MKLKTALIVAWLIAMWAASLLLTGCATKAKCTAHAVLYQDFAKANHWTSEVGMNPEMAGWQMRIAKEGWTEDLTDDLIDYLHELLLYAPVGPCGTATGVCSPGAMQKYGYKGMCMSCGSYMYHTFKYLDYPRGVRIGLVREFGIGHQVTRIERPDGTWRMINSFSAFGLHYLDEPFYHSIIDFDDKGIY